MSKTLAAILFSAAVIFTGCTPPEQTKVNINTNTGTADSKAEPKKDDSETKIPKTEKIDGEYVESETGTEKAKPEAGKANVQGKVLFNDKPAEGVEVKICEKFNRFIAGCDGESYKTKTDANGEYFFANVKPGVYEGLLIQIFNTKTVIFATRGIGISSAKYKFDADQTFFAPVTDLFKEDLKVQTPKAKSTVQANNLEIKWDAYPDAAYYELSLSPEKGDYDFSISDERVEGTSYKVEKSLKNGKYTLSLKAFNANEKKLSETEEEIEFTVAGGTNSDADDSGSDTDKK